MPVRRLMTLVLRISISKFRTRRRGDGETRRLGDKETWRQGEGETGRQGERSE